VHQDHERHVLRMQVRFAHKFAKGLDVLYKMTIDGSFEKLYLEDHCCMQCVLHAIVCCAEIRKSA